jgi:hypothetical protein
LLAGKAHTRRRRKRSRRDLAKAKPRRRRRRIEAVEEAVGIPGLEEARKQSSEQQECPPVTKRRRRSRIPQTQQKIAKIEASRACTRISQKKTEEKEERRSQED